MIRVPQSLFHIPNQYDKMNYHLNLEMLFLPEFDEFSTQGDNQAVRYRTAHRQWLLDNGVFSLNGMNEWQPDLRRWTPSSSARYPLRMKTSKPPIDPEIC